MHSFYLLLVADVQETEFVMDTEIKEVAGTPVVRSRERLLHNQEASIRERMRHEIVFKTNENCSDKYLFFFFLCGFRWMLFSTFPRVIFVGLVKQYLSFKFLLGYKRV